MCLPRRLALMAMCTLGQRITNSIDSTARPVFPGGSLKRNTGSSRLRPSVMMIPFTLDHRTIRFMRRTSGPVPGDGSLKPWAALVPRQSLVRMEFFIWGHTMIRYTPSRPQVQAWPGLPGRCLVKTPSAPGAHWKTDNFRQATGSEAKQKNAVVILMKVDFIMTSPLRPCPALHRPR